MIDDINVREQSTSINFEEWPWMNDVSLCREVTFVKEL